MDPMTRSSSDPVTGQTVGIESEDARMETRNPLRERSALAAGQANRLE
jgi:hypothetical protein